MATPAGLQLAEVMSDRLVHVIMQVEWPDGCQTADEDGDAEAGDGDRRCYRREIIAQLGSVILFRRPNYNRGIGRWR